MHYYIISKYSLNHYLKLTAGPIRLCSIGVNGVTPRILPSKLTEYISPAKSSKPTSFSALACFVASSTAVRMSPSIFSIHQLLPNWT